MWWVLVTSTSFWSPLRFSVQISDLEFGGSTRSLTASHFQDPHVATSKKSIRAAFAHWPLFLLPDPGRWSLLQLLRTPQPDLKSLATWTQEKQKQLSVVWSSFLPQSSWTSSQSLFYPHKDQGKIRDCLPDIPPPASSRNLPLTVLCLLALPVPKKGGKNPFLLPSWSRPAASPPRALLTAQIASPVNYYSRLNAKMEIIQEETKVAFNPARKIHADVSRGLREGEDLTLAGVSRAAAEAVRCHTQSLC